jgi:regulatory protein
MDNFEIFYKSSINFLSFRQRSEKEMRIYLQRKTKNLKLKDSEDIINSIIESLKRDKFINDEEFARMWIQSRTRVKPRAWRVIKSELKMKGISEEIIENAYGLLQMDNSDESSAIKLAEKKLRTIHDTDKYKIREKLGRYLASKGFDWDTVKEVIDKVLNN